MSRLWPRATRLMSFSHGGEIVTVAADAQEADRGPEAVAVKDGVIVHVGDYQETVDR